MRYSVFVLTAISALNLLAQVKESTGMPPRAAPADYQSSAKAGTFTLAAEFVGHSVPTLLSPLSSEDYVVVEAAFFGPPETKLKLSWEDFSIRINGKKSPTPATPHLMALKSLKDPEWLPPTPAEPSKSKSSFGGGGGGGAQGDPKPEPPKMTLPERRAMEQKALKVVFPEGERPVPQAGLLFFPYRGKDAGIESVELIYSGPAGSAVLRLR